MCDILQFYALLLSLSAGHHSNLIGNGMTTVNVQNILVGETIKMEVTIKIGLA